MITNQFLKIWLLSFNIINFKEILLIFLNLRRSRINEVRLQNLYLALCKHSLYNSGRGRVDDLSFFEYLSPFCFLSIEIHCTFSISYKILPYFIYYYCILVRM